MKIYTEDTVVKIAHYHYATNELIKVEEITVQAHTGIPAFTSEILPKEIRDGYALIFNPKKQKWEYIEDHRGEKYYSTQDGSEIEITEFGALPDNVTDQPKPEGFYQWGGNAWIEDQTAKDSATEQMNITRLEYEQSRTEAEIKVYERMRDRNRADEDDLKMLEALEDYSIDLKKAIKQKGWPLEVDWPIAPNF